MISIDLATRLATALARAGRAWSPAAGDRFHIPNRDLDQIFVIADMTIEVHDLPTGRLLGFNGTTEWALDSIQARDVVWLPREDQLRDLLGHRFRALEALDSPVGGFVVVLDDGSRHLDTDAERAYAHAVLHALG